MHWRSVGGFLIRREFSGKTLLKWQQGAFVGEAEGEKHQVVWNENFNRSKNELCRRWARARDRLPTMGLIFNSNKTCIQSTDFMEYLPSRARFEKSSHVIARSCY